MEKRKIEGGGSTPGVQSHKQRSSLPVKEEKKTTEPFKGDRGGQVDYRREKKFCDEKIKKPGKEKKGSLIER